MKNLLAILFVLSLFLTSCETECDLDNLPPACSETVPNEACQATFLRWFYNDEINSCEEISYSGCDAYGFATQGECETCICNN